MKFKYSFLLLLFLPFTVQAKTVFLQIRDFNFSPNFIEIDQGDTILWTNSGNMPHTVEGGGIDSGTINPQETFEFTFNEPGTVDYICGLHPSMTGRINVLAVESAAAPADDLLEEVLIDEPAAQDESQELGSLSDFFEATAPQDDPAPTFQNVEETSIENIKMQHSPPISGNAALATSGGSWLYALAFGLLGAFLFLGMARR